MKRKEIRPRLLVIDSDVVATATGNENPRSIICLLTLNTVLQSGHQVLLTPAIATEWNNRFPKFAALWLKQLKSRRQLVERIDEPDCGIAGALQKLGVTAEILVIMLKDRHLLEAALIADQTVFSMDETAYYHFYDAARSISLIRPIMWANPERATDACVDWLTTGARPAKNRRIGIRPRRGMIAE